MAQNVYERIEEIQAQLYEALNGNTKLDLTIVDKNGITAQQRLQWAIDSIAYIKAIAAGVPGIEAVTKGDYILEGLNNLQVAVSILNGEYGVEAKVKAEDETSVVDRIKAVLAKKKADSDTNLKAENAKLKAENAELQERAKKAETEVKALRAKLQAMGIAT
ncbi:MAG: hypothetical protein IJH12_01185 [Clostridia bacterium]|nr:hypothetical protein [Clostridia bacterium]